MKKRQLRKTNTRMIAARESLKIKVELDTIFSSLIEPLIIYDTQGKIVNANAAAVASLGFNPKGLTQKDIEAKIFSHLKNGGKTGIHNMISTRALRGEIIRDEPYLFMNSSGEERAVIASAAPIRNKDSITGAVLVWHDMTEQEKIKAALEKVHNELELKVAQRTAELVEANKQLNQEMLAAGTIEKHTQASNAILQLLSKNSSRREYLDAVVNYFQKISNCRCVGIRVLTEDGKIPYDAHVGFNDEFLKLGNNISILHDQCACIRVITGKLQIHDQSVLTPMGSFYSNNLPEFIALLSAHDKTKFRDECVGSGFTSVAIMPIRYGDMILGIIQLADEHNGSVPRQLVEFIESLTPLIGEGINKFNLADKIKLSYDIQSTINSLLRLSLKDITLEELLNQALDTIVSIPWLAFDKTASIFLIEDETQSLVLKAHIGLSKHIQSMCARVGLGQCICGKAALSRQLQFIDCVDKNHEIRYEDMPNHGHYCVPVLFVNNVLGVINIYLKVGYYRDQKKEEFLISIAAALAGIIQRKQTENKLNKSNELLERVFSSTHFLVAYLDKNLDFIRVNQAYAKADGHTPDFYAGRHYFELFPNEENKSIFRKVIETAEPYSVYAKPFIYKDRPERGTTYWDWSLQPVTDHSGKVEGLILGMVDVTERWRAEEELNKAHQALLEAKRLSDIGTLAATVAHELRNPLGVIRTAAYNIKKKAPDHLLDRHIDNIEKKILESDQIINNLLFYSRIKMPHYEQVSLYDLLEESLMNTKKKFLDWRVTVNKRYRGIKKYLIEADPLQIREVFNNILNNSYESLTEKNGKVEITAGFDDNKHEMYIAFKDNGSGIEPEDLKRLGEPFFTKKSKGTGLGLTVSYQIINLHNGKIEVESAKDNGTKFTIILPVKKKRP